MLNIYSLQDGALVETSIVCFEQLKENALWVNLTTPTEDERQWVRDAYEQELTTTELMEEIEASSRFYEDEQGLHLHAYFLKSVGDRVVNVTVGFTLNQNRIFTLTPEDLPVFTDFAQLLKRTPSRVNLPFSILLGLFETEIDRLADLLERLYKEVSQYDKAFFSSGQKDLENILMHIASIEEMNGRARLNLIDEQRTLSSLLRSGKLSEKQQVRLSEMLRDIDSLLSHSAALFEKVKFLMDVIMGKINIEQNKIIKIFSIAAVVFLPPTLVASVYGMNFEFMPELSWELGYPFAILLMVTSGIAPYWLFKRKGWL
ncbi:magnesium/cobalt transporter CorA [Leucothrix arctica]|uniref:Magnesium transport protein CorA n=1 Tax=Leucothrix arctica TaxID=1481894 RepID=A0A317CCL5_9GAMM|nr:magnesium/cobalt transporter CorA [Leucothrix arctica]PWQ93832.1 magnesium and cobalt transport protein CorA [Leucothrix arctica]